MKNYKTFKKINNSTIILNWKIEIKHTKNIAAAKEFEKSFLKNVSKFFVANKHCNDEFIKQVFPML